MLGKKPAEYLKPAELPVIPAEFGHETLVSEWGMLGNDRYGDCVWAGAAHETMLWNMAAGRVVPFTPEGVLSDYSAVTGFAPQDPNTDEGTDVHDALNYRQQTGILDAQGNRHKIGAYVSLDPKDLGHLWAAMFIFEAVGIGFMVPDYAMRQFEQGQPWDVVGDPQTANIEGGHYVCTIAKRAGLIDLVTWAMLHRMTTPFYGAFNDESYGILSLEMLTGDKSLEGFDKQLLLDDLAALAR